MSFCKLRSVAVLLFGAVCLGISISPAPAQSSSNAQQGSSSSTGNPQVVREKAPSLVDPAGPTISLVPSESVFFMASALNACGYDEGLDDSAPVRKRVRDEMNASLARSEDARKARDQLCLYIAQHRTTGTGKDVAQYISLALYLTPPPELETSVELTEMPPDSTQVVEMVPLLKAFAKGVDLHGTWLAIRRIYDDEV